MQETEYLARSKFLIIPLFLFSQTIILSQVYPEGRVDSLLRTGIRYIVNQDYAGAELFFNSLNNEYPQLPLGKIYLAANKIAEAYDYAEEFDEAYIHKNLDAAREQAEILIEKDENNIWYHYFYALTEGYTAYFHAINESWLSALSTGVNSIYEFEKIVNINDKFFEAYIAIGTFEYWKSRKMEFMSWLPFNDDTKKNGIDRLVVAIDSSSYNSYLAINSLIWIYIDQKKYKDAINVAEKALIEFPNSRTFRWGMARAYEEVNVSKAIELYSEILESYPVLPNGNYINEITLKHIIAQQYVKLGDKQNALKYCNEILSIKNLPKKTADKLSERIERVKNLKIELTNTN